MANYVGFANLPNQVHRKSVKKGFEFTLMVVGKCFIRLLKKKDLFSSYNLIQVLLFNPYK